MEVSLVPMPFLAVTPPLRVSDAGYICLWGPGRCAHCWQCYQAQTSGGQGPGLTHLILHA